MLQMMAVSAITLLFVGVSVDSCSPLSVEFVLTGGRPLPDEPDSQIICVVQERCDVPRQVPHAPRMSPSTGRWNLV